MKIEKEISLSWLERKCLQTISNDNRIKGINLANEICKNYPREGAFFDEILDSGLIREIKMNPIDRKLCDIQGRLFELSLDSGLDSESFIKSFMLSNIAKVLIQPITVCNGLEKNIFLKNS